MNKTLGKIISVLVLLFPMLVTLTAGVTAQAAEETVTVNLHKRVFENGESLKTPYPKQNTGEEMADFGGKPLNGVTFEVYDVSSEYTKLLATNDDKQATAKIVADAKAASYAPSYATKVGDKVVTAGEGVATFTDLPMKKDGGYASYLFVETNSPSNVSEKAAPIVLTLPVYKGNTETVNTMIHLYPKNEKQKLIDKDLTDETKAALKTTINGQDFFNVEIGKPFSYGITAGLPWNIKDKHYYRLTDTPDAGMSVIKDTVKVASLTKGTDYIIYTDASKRGYIIDFNVESPAVLALAGKRVSITYDVILSSDAQIDLGINNSAYVELGTVTRPEDKPKWPVTPPTDYPDKPTDPTNPEIPDKPTDPTDPGTPDKPVTGPEVFTGAKKFKKVDLKSGQTLAGAKFKLARVDADNKVIAYATLKDGKYTWANDEATATAFESNAEGLFEIKGLEYSAKLTGGISYALVEFEAPEGYALLTKPVKFDVIKDDYATQTLSIENIKKGLLPSTGGNGIYMFLAAGTVLMAGAIVWYRRSRAEAEV
ncbi:hypothetical protein CBF34_10645 [Vagococcus penaei]|uniref:Uncharacterized protein n=1 Tax=Vagococcus penaei TaxID=633807 RepID=A0A1Q2D5X4_9ENTE|nr:SpaH/EbpB family LPXTG-anchored major pilin [Vagococcus penaei]AQP53733.1 hypothetical protein BW732_05435 [Vagococcus penaei]RST98164.1 hypothetical protein CBF34_10645 [Vagococcus penaei]